MNKINFENGTLISPAKVEVDGVVYEVIPELYDGATPLTADILNQLQKNVEDAINDVTDEVDALMTYSTNEKVVGTWIDGKPLYEKTIIGTKQSGVDFTAIIGTNIDTAFIVSGFILATTGTVYALDRYENDYTYTRTEIYENEFTFKSSTGQYTNGTVVATIRYTKTTD